MASQYISIESIRFHFKHEGDKTNPLVILSHALMANHQMWDQTVQCLHKAGFSTLRYDHVGHNKTIFESLEAADKQYHFDDFTRQISLLVEHVTPEQKPFAIIGCSMGGVLALRFAQMYPGVLTKVMSCDAPGMTSLESAKPLWESRLAEFAADGVKNLAQATIDRWFPDPCSTKVRQDMLDQTQSCTFQGYKACANGIMSYDYLLQLEALKYEQVLILAGENDSAIGPREILIDVASRIAGAKYVLMQDVGHIPPFHDSERFNKIMLDFLLQ